MLYEKKQVKELLYLRHRHDTKDNYVKYDEKILNNTTTPYLFKNNLMKQYVSKLQPLISLIFDHMNVIKNLKNYIVDKNYYKH